MNYVTQPLLARQGAAELKRSRDQGVKPAYTQLIVNTLIKMSHNNNSNTNLKILSLLPL